MLCPERVSVHSLLHDPVQAGMLWVQTTLHQDGQQCLLCSLLAQKPPPTPKEPWGPILAVSDSDNFVMGETKPWARRNKTLIGDFTQGLCNSRTRFCCFVPCFFLDNT